MNMADLAREQLSSVIKEAWVALRAGLKGQVPSPQEAADLQWAVTQDVAGRYLIATGRGSPDVRQGMLEGHAVVADYGTAHAIDARTLFSQAVDRGIQRGLEIGLALAMRAVTGGAL